MSEIDRRINGQLGEMREQHYIILYKYISSICIYTCIIFQIYIYDHNCENVCNILYILNHLVIYPSVDNPPYPTRARIYAYSRLVIVAIWPRNIYTHMYMYMCIYRCSCIQSCVMMRCFSHRRYEGIVQ